MDAGLKIEDPEALPPAQELATLTGASIHDAVLQALQDRVQRQRDLQACVADILAAAAEVRALMQHPLPTSDHSWLYDENGLPA